MKTSEFFFELPTDLIAQYPPEQRGHSRLMTLNRITGKREHRMVEDLPEIVSGPEFRGTSGELPLLVFNNSKVRKARLIGKSLQTGAEVEFLLLEKAGNREPLSVIGSETGYQCDQSAINKSAHCSLIWKALAHRAQRRKIGSRYVFFDADAATEIAQAEIIGAEGGYRVLAFDRPIDDAWLDRYGHIPLPPYIKRQDAQADAQRYQTVYAAATGSSAAPTAGLHFTHRLLERLAAAGIESAFITLHVGLGTFLPVRSENIEDHVMHSESFCIDEQTAEKIVTAKAAGRKIVAVGTTSVRTLESIWGGEYGTGALSDVTETGTLGDSARNNPDPRFPLQGNTSIFIQPGYRFKIVDALFTNFHTPESTLLMLVAAFAGKDLILESYAEAIGEGYRFFSYGDAMLIS